MQNLIINSTPKSFDIQGEPGKIEIKGCSIINDPRSFFKPLQIWVDNYLKDPPEDTVIVIKIEYIDSSSTKNIFDILKSFEKLTDMNKKVQVNWYYDLNDPEILEVGEILAGRIKVPFNFILY